MRSFGTLILGLSLLLGLPACAEQPGKKKEEKTEVDDQGADKAGEKKADEKKVDEKKADEKAAEKKE